MVHFWQRANLYNSLECNLEISIRIKGCSTLWSHNSVNSAGNSCRYTGKEAQIDILGQEYSWQCYLW